MAFRQSKHYFQGMNRSLAFDKHKAESLYIDAHNVRIITREDHTLYAITNEKGNTKLNLKFTNKKEVTLDELGKYLGHTTLDNYIIVFCKATDSLKQGKIVKHNDIIWKIDVEKLTIELLYDGELNFDTKYPIEASVDIESDSIKKVYWTDDYNQPRVINITRTYTYNTNLDIDSQFDFIPKVLSEGTNLNVTIEKINNSEGIFKAGTIQYFITYYNVYGQESNIVWQSPLLYISPIDRGGSSSETVSNAFKLTINAAKNDFDRIRIYSVQHTSEDTSAIARRVVDLNNSDSITFLDTGTEGEAIDPADLYFKGGTPISTSTMCAKDGTLFLGNIKLNSTEYIPKEIATEIKELWGNVTFTGRVLSSIEDASNTYYKHDNQLQSKHISTFKSNETYRFGLQFQDKYGRWSIPVHLNDVKNTVFPYIARINPRSPEYKISVSEAFIKLNNSELISKLKDLGYVNVRPLVVLPEKWERECIAQGVLCPTVYNVGDRIDNSPFAQPSWFFRPYSNTPNYDMYGKEASQGKIKDGTVLPFIHNSKILGQTSLQGEIELVSSAQIPPVVYRDQDVNSITSKLDKRDFYVDQSIVTLNSPDIEFEDSISNNDGYSFRIVGAINISGFSGALHIDATQPNHYYEKVDDMMVKRSESYGFVQRDIIINNYNSTNGWKVMGSGPYWVDAPYKLWTTGSGLTTAFSVYPSDTQKGFVIYPWQSTGSLNGSNGIENYTNTDTVEHAPYIESAILKRKTLSNIRYSSETVYLGNNKTYKTADIKFVNPQIDSVIALKSPKGDKNFYYYSDIDKLLDIPEDDKGYNSVIVSNTQIIPSKIGDVKNTILDENNSAIQYKALESKDDEIIVLDGKKKTATSITYKSTSHAIIELDKINLNNTYGVLEPSETGNITAFQILPSINNCGKIDTSGTASYGAYNNTDRNSQNVYEICSRVLSNGSYTDERLFWDNETSYICQDNYNINFVTSDFSGDTSGFGTLLIGEIYNPNVVNKFGGTSEDALANNKWIPAGESVPLSDDSILRWIDGDTYFQRYDCLKTYPYSNNNENNIVEILSFMCESRTNIDGRHDKNRGLKDNEFITNENFNLINPVYSQKNNFMSYTILDERFKNKKFTNQITWTKTKSNAALIDNWTNITLANTLDLDGDKGEITSLKLFRSNIIAFQEKAISQIQYNDNVQISTNNNAPIELANSGKVRGKVYFNYNAGCQNKWSIVTDTSGNIYFVDNYNKEFYRLGGEKGLEPLISVNGLSEWFDSQNNIYKWVPFTTRPNNFRVFYDTISQDIYLTNHTTCLVYSTLLGKFVSFMDYQMTDAMFNINGKFYSIYHNSLWEQFSGEYNKIYDVIRDYWVTFIENKNPEFSKIFTNLEYSSDVYDGKELKSFETFDTLRVYNEYQDTGNVEIKRVLNKPANLQKKFRIWRVQIPRDKNNKFDRIRNTWANITLKSNNRGTDNTNKLILYDAIVGYYI